MKLLRLLLLALTWSLTHSSALAGTSNVTGHTNDVQINDAGTADWSGQTTMRVGGSSSSHDAAAFFIFQLPTLATGEAVVDASLSFELESIANPGTINGNADLYGLDYRASASASGSDYYQGTYDGDGSATALQNDILTPSSGSGSITTSSTGDDNLIDYLNAQYLAGAEGGDYVVIRVNTDVSDEGDYRYYNLYSANSSGYEPVLTIVTDEVVTETEYDITGHTNDIQINSNGGSDWINKTTIRIGGSSSGIDAAAFFIFALPSLDSGEYVSSASLSFNLDSIANAGSLNGNADLYGLDYRSTATASFSDYFQGSYGTDSSAAALQNDILTPSSGSGTITTDSTGSSNLADYLDDQYIAGAAGGDYVVLRINPDVADEGNYRYFTVDTADHGTSANRPVMTMSIASSGIQVTTPTFSPVAGTYSSTQSVSISTSTTGASIRYTTDGSTPTSTTGTLYSGAVSVSGSSTLKAIAYKSGMTDSAVASAAYTINLATVSAPTFSPAGGTFTSSQEVTVTSSTTDATIRYTTDGSIPSPTNGMIYSGSITIEDTTTVKAIAYKSGMNDSAVVTETYTINIPVVEAPILSPEGGTFTSAQSIAITSATSGAEIRYTTDGSDPSSNTGTIYSGAFTLNASATVKAIAYKSGMLDSSITTETYTINIPSVEAPTFSPGSGTYAGTQSVSIATATSGATIRYTTDGSTPTSITGTVYSSAISVTANATLKAIAYKSGMNDSSVTTASYTIVSAGNEYEIDGDTGDIEIRTNSTYDNSSTYMRIGGTGSGVDGAACLIFELPTLAAGEYVSGASLEFELDSIANAGSLNGNADLYGLDYRATNTATVSEYYQGSYNGDATATALQDDIMTPSSSNGAVTTDSTGSANLANYIDAQYSAGAEGGDFIALRINSDVADEGNYRYYKVLSASSASKPMLTIQTSAIPEQVATPGFSPAGGSYSAVQSVTISSATSGATIRYTTDGSTPSETSGTVYSGAVSLDATITLKAIAYASGMTTSDVASAAYTITLPDVANPSFSPVAGIYSSSQSVTLSTTTSGASIRYTTDGSTPTSTTGTVYSSAISVSSTATIKAIAYKSGMNDSAVVSATYTISTGGDITLDAGDGFYNEALSTSQTSAFSAEFDATPSESPSNIVIGFSPDEADFYNDIAAIVRFNTSGFIDARDGSAYTADNAIPFSANTLYSFRMEIDVPNRTYSIFVTEDGGSEQIAGTDYSFRTEQGSAAQIDYFTATVEVSESGEVLIENLTIGSPVAPVEAPAFSVAEGTYSSTQNVSITTGTSGATIRYTTDGSTPTSSSGTIYSSAVSISSTTILKAIAYKSGMSDSTVTTATYTINTGSALVLDAGDGFYNEPLASTLTGSFRAEFDVTPSIASTNAVIGFASDIAFTYSSIATIVRFNPSGYIDARDGNTYDADATISYSASTTYHVRMEIDVPSHTYSVYVTPSGSSEQTLAANFAFRSEQASITGITQWTGVVETSASGSITLENLSISNIGQAVAIPSLSPTGGNYSTTQTVSMSSTTSGASIRYTTDGSTPTSTTGTVYSSPVSISSSTTVKAIAYKSGLADSPVRTETYSITSAPPGVDPELTNYKTGIDVVWGGQKGVDYMEEYLYHDKLVTDRKVVYIKSGTTITMNHNERNSSSNAYFPIIGENGGGVIRYKIDQDMRHDRGWSGSYGNLVLNPAYSGPFTLGGLKYPDGTTSVVGTTGDNGGSSSSKTGYWWRGIVDDVGDEWHVLTVADDDAAVSSDPEKKAGDGKVHLLVVNPKTPAMTVRATGNGEFYTTPAKTYFVPKIHTQTTYIDPNSGGVTFEIRDINGNNIHYRIVSDPNDSSTSYTSVGATNITLSDSDFSNGTQYLQYYYNASYKKTRKVVKNPTHPSLAETHGHLMAGSSGNLTTVLGRVWDDLYDDHYSLIRSNDYWNKQSTWDANSHKGMRYPYQGIHPANPTTIFHNTFVALKEGWTYTRSGKSKSFGQYAKEMLLENMRTIDPVGFEIRHDGYPIPARELINRGYYDVNPILDSMLSYDIFAGHFRDDQVTGGLTPIEDYFFRDLMADFVVEQLKWLGNGTALDPGMWCSARNCGAMMIAIYMPTYSTTYYGTSGFDGSSTSTYAWTPYPTTQATWKEYFWDESTSLTGYPNQTYAFDPTNYVIVNDTQSPYYGHWRHKLQYSDFSLMGRPLMFLLNVTKLHNSSKNYPVIELMKQNGVEGDLLGIHPSSGELYPGGTAEHGPKYQPNQLLMNARFQTHWSIGWPKIESSSDSNRKSLVSIAGPVSFFWMEED